MEASDLQNVRQLVQGTAFPESGAVYRVQGHQSVHPCNAAHLHAGTQGDLRGEGSQGTHIHQKKAALALIHLLDQTDCALQHLLAAFLPAHREAHSVVIL